MRSALVCSLLLGIVFCFGDCNLAIGQIPGGPGGGGMEGDCDNLLRQIQDAKDQLEDLREFNDDLSDITTATGQDIQDVYHEIESTYGFGLSRKDRDELNNLKSNADSHISASNMFLDDSEHFAEQADTKLDAACDLAAAGDCDQAESELDSALTSLDNAEASTSAAEDNLNDAIDLLEELENWEPSED